MQGTDTRTLLLVEDEAIIALAEKKIIERHGFEVVPASSAEKAFEVLTTEKRIDLILMDINLGSGMSGTEAAERIVAEHEIPVVFLSSHTEREVVEKTEGISSYGYIVKNSGETVLIASIKMAFRLFYANQKAKKAGNRLRATLNAIPDLMFVVDKDGYFQDYAGNYSGIPLAMEPDTIIGAQLGDIFPPEEVKTHLQLYRSCIETELVQTHHYELVIEGERRPFDLRVAKLDETHILAIIRDLTEKQKTDLELRTISQAVEQSPVTVIITDRDAHIEYVNPKFSELTGYTESEVLGKNPRILQSGHTPEKVYRELWDTVTAGKEWRGIFWNRKKNNELYCEQASIAPVKDEEGCILRYIAVKEDISKQKQQEEDLRRILREKAGDE